MTDLLQDFRFGFRSLLQRPAFVIVVALTLGLGVGPTTAIFSALKASLLGQYPPMFEQDRVASIFSMNLQAGADRGGFSSPDYFDLREQSTVFQYVAAFRSVSFHLTGAGEPVRVAGLSVTPDYFRVLHLQPQLGRVPRADEDRPGMPPVVLLSHGLWQRQFGGDQSIVGRTIYLDHEAFVVIGVMAPGMIFRALGVELWTTPATDADSNGRARRSLSVLGRLKRGFTWEQAGQELKSIAHRLEQEHPETNTGWEFRAVPVNEDRAKRMAQSLLMLLIPAILVVLVACGNVMNLLLARTAARGPEIAVRAALGAGRFRLFRQLLTEGVLLAVFGAAAGLGLALGGMRLLRLLMHGISTDVAQNVSMDAQVFSFGIVLSLLTPIFFALAPALQACKPDLSAALKVGGVGGGHSARKRLRGTLVAVQVTLATLLLVPTAVLLRFYAAVETWDFGNAVNKLLVVRVEPPEQSATNGKDYWLSLLARAEQAPGVEAVAAATVLPNLGARPRPTALEAEVSGSARMQVFAVETTVSPGYFALVGLPVRAGRDFTPQDVPGSPAVCIVNDALARRVWPGENPLGKPLRPSGEPGMGWAAVAGVVSDFPNEPGREGPPQRVFFPLTQRLHGEPVLLVRAGVPDRVVPGLKDAIRSAGLDQPVVDIRTIQQIASEQMADGYGLAGLLGSFALLALALSAFGIYSVVDYSVAQRTREIGIRMALGARTVQILRAVLREGLLPTMAGVALGLIGSWSLLQMAAHEMGALRINLHVPLISLCAATVVALVGVLACTAPARRAARLDPLVALRYE